MHLLKSWTVPGLAVRSKNWLCLSVWSRGLRESLRVCSHRTHVISSLVLYRNSFLEPTDMFVHLVPPIELEVTGNYLETDSQKQECSEHAPCMTSEPWQREPGRSAGGCRGAGCLPRASRGRFAGPRGDAIGFTGRRRTCGKCCALCHKDMFPCPPHPRLSFGVMGHALAALCRQKEGGGAAAVILEVC